MVGIFMFEMQCLPFDSTKRPKDLLQMVDVDFSSRLFSGCDYSSGANVSANAAVNASFRRDDVDVAFRDRRCGAFFDASATCNAIFIDNVSHCVRI